MKKTNILEVEISRFLVVFFFLTSIIASISAQTTIQLGQTNSFSQTPKSTANYQVNLQSPGEVTISISNWLSTFSWIRDFDRIYITNNLGASIGRNSLSSDADPFLFHMFQGTKELKFRVGQAGVYNIAVHSGDIFDWGTATSQNYTMLVTAVYCNDKNEPNDTFESATVINIDSTISAYQWKQIKTTAIWDDEDWYKITINSPGILKFKMANWIGVFNWSTNFDRLWVYNSKGVSIGKKGGYDFYSWMMGGTDSIPIVIEMNLAHADTYYFRFHAGDGTSLIPYHFTTTFKPSNDSFEPNDKFADAKQIHASNIWYQANQWRSLDSTMNVTGDEDWYKITINSPGILKIKMANWIGTYNWNANYDRLWVYNSKGVSIGKKGGNDFYSWMMGGTDSIPLVIEMNLAHADTYYLKFYSGEGISLNPYSFNASFTSTNDSFEPNDKFADAKQIHASNIWYQANEWRSLDSTMTVTPDEDYYFFMASGAGQYSITLDGWIGIFNWSADYDRLFIYDASENAVGASPMRWMMGTAPMEFTVPSAGKYYIRLHCGSAYSVDGYKFKLTGNIVGLNDIDGSSSFFQLYPNPASSTIQLKVNGSGGVKVICDIYNSIGMLVKSEMISQDLHSINVDNLPDGYYNVIVRHNGSTYKQSLLIRK